MYTCLIYSPALSCRQGIASRFRMQAMYLGKEIPGLKLLSDAAEYALRAMVFLAQEPSAAWKVRKIAEHTRSTPGYLVKVLQQLARADLVSAQRGIHGGYTLLIAPERVSMADVINAVDPIERFESCPLGLAAHGRKLCPMHCRIDEALAQIERTFSSITIADLIRKTSTSRSTCDLLHLRGDSRS